MVGVEIDFVVSDSVKALGLYEQIFEVERLEVTDFQLGQNEAIFSLYGVRFHMLDENPEFQLMAPSPERPNTIWYNIIVPDIKETFSKALQAGCTEIQGVTDIPEMGVSNAVFLDPFGYQWMLHQIHREVSFEERNQMWEEKLKNQE